MIDLGPGGTVAVVDVGGTDIKTAVLCANGQLMDIQHQPTPRGPDAAETIMSIAGQHADHTRATQGDLASIGLIVPGIVDAGRGVAVFSENLNWHDVPFRRRVAQATGIPVGFGHDVATAGWAEVTFGAARGVADVAVLVVGTGVAAALYSNTMPVLSGGWAGEIGHSIVDSAGPACQCGARGCLEALASSAAIARRYSERSGTTVTGSREVLRRRNNGDLVAAQVWDEAIAALAIGIRQLAATLSPRVVVIGGGLSLAGSDLLAPLNRAIAETVPPHRVPEIRQASIGVYAGLVGAAMLGREVQR
ncbi:MAG: ROK family protein [Beutenbergiaceae bacterium]